MRLACWVLITGITGLSSDVLASPPADWSSTVSWGAVLPKDATPENDWPWATEEGSRCAWDAETLLCDDGGGIARAYRRWEGAVAGEPAWIRCVGLEWCAGTQVSQVVDGREQGRWASRVAPHGGWEWAVPASASTAAVSVEPVAVTMVGGEVWGASEAMLAAVGACPGASVLDEFPVAVLYDEQGARKVRLQGFPPESLDVICLVEALSAAPRPPEGAAVEVMLTAVSAPR